MKDEPLGVDDNRQGRGTICLANEARFTAANFSEPLTAFAQGWKDPENLEAQLDVIAPPVTVGRRFEYKSAVNAEAFLSEADDIRAIGSPFKRVEYKGSSVNQKTLNKGLTIRLDNDEMLVPNSRENAVALLRARLIRNDLRRAVAGLVAGATNTAKTWDTTALKDPDADVLADLITGGDDRGIESNQVVYGQTAWQKRALSHRAQTSAGGFASAAMNEAALAAILGVDRVVVCKARYQSGAATKTKIVGAYVLMYYVSPSAMLDDPSNIKRFVTPTESGPIRVYVEEHAKYVDVSVEHYSNVVVTSTLGLRMFTIS
jgi:hypothetical protein